MAKKRDVLLGMAKAGNHLGDAPLLTNNNWAKGMNEQYPGITSTFSEGLSDEDLTELKRLQCGRSKDKQR
jgi:hypothetical protein